MDLKCRQLNCKYNNTYCCTRKGILVNTQNVCSDFNLNPTPSKKQQQDASKDMFKKEPKIHPYRHNKKINISCKSNCLFNEGGTCMANGICVEECKKQKATCITHIIP